MTLMTLGALFVICVLALTDWRRALFMCTVMGLLQDPLRKLAPGQPIYYVVLVGVVFGVAWMRAYSGGVNFRPRIIHGWRAYLRQPVFWLGAIVAFQAIHSFFLYRSPMLTGVGLLVWLAPFPAVMLAYQFTLRRGLNGVKQWMQFYAILALFSLAGVYLQYAGYGWRALGEVGEGLVIYDVGTALQAYSGFFRSSEIAAWHTAAIACLIFTLSVGKRATLARLATALALIVLLIGLGLLTGRRKLLVEVTVFLSMYFMLVAWIQKGAGKIAVFLLLIGVVGYIGFAAFISPDTPRTGGRPTALSAQEAQRIKGYAERGRSVFAEVPERVRALGIEPVAWAIREHGWLGAGLGTGSQGVQGVIDERDLKRGGSEGGLGKITMELGFPGLIVAGWMLYAFFRHVLRQLKVLTRTSPHHARISYGIVAFLIANGATFAVASQAYNDLFALLILGWCVGFLLAMPALAERELAQRSGASSRPLQPGLRTFPGEAHAPTVPAPMRPAAP